MTETATYVTVNGRTCISARVTIGNTGPWAAELHLPSADEITNPVTLRIGTLTMVGSIVTDGVYGEQRKLRIVGGAGGWAKVLAPWTAHNDTGVKASFVAQYAARDAGETLGSFAVARERLGPDYTREARAASRTLESVIGDAAWWVDYAGVTQVGERPASTLASGAYTVLDYNPAERTATLIADDPTTIQVGALLVDGIDTARVIRELEITANGDEPLRFHVWLGGAVSGAGRLASLLTAIVRQVEDGHLYGLYRYRVIEQASDDRVHAQPVNQSLGLPDVHLVPIWPGTSGTRMRLAMGANVLVTFIDGDRAYPIVMGHEPSNGSGFVPVSLVIGGTVGPAAARVGDAVSLPLAAFTATIGGVSTACTVTSWAGQGSIAAGSSRVGIA